MNIQVCIPHQTCVYRCPSCIARGRPAKFENVWQKDRTAWGKALQFVLSNEKKSYASVVITGDCDPSQNEAFMKEVSDMVADTGAGERGMTLEVQTRNYHFPIKEWFDTPYSVLCYSIINSAGYLYSPHLAKLKKGKNRLVILLTEDFKFLKVENFQTYGFDQITFKVLQLTADPKTNEWIEANRLKDLTPIYEIVESYNTKSCSVRIDTNCQDSYGRYLVYREDGKFYESWEAEKSLGE